VRRLAHCPEWRFGDSHSPVGLAELACLPGLVARTFLTKIATFITHIRTSLLRYLYTVIVLRSSLNRSARLLYDTSKATREIWPWAGKI